MAGKAILVGQNGSGKSTLVDAVAIAHGRTSTSWSTTAGSSTGRAATCATSSGETA